MRGTIVRFHRLAGFSGIGFGLILIVANIFLIASGFPSPSEELTPQQVVDSLTASRPVLRIVSTLLPAVWLLSSIFAAGVYREQSGTDRGRVSGWPLLGLAGVLLQNVTFAVVSAVRIGLSSVSAPDDIGGLWSLYYAVFGFNQVFLAMALLGFTVGGLRGKLLPRWHAGLGFAGAALLFAASTTAPLADVNPLSLLGLVGWLLWVAWIAVYGAALLRRPAQRIAG